MNIQRNIARFFVRVANVFFEGSKNEYIDYVENNIYSRKMSWRLDEPNELKQMLIKNNSIEEIRKYIRDVFWGSN